MSSLSLALLPTHISGAALLVALLGTCQAGSGKQVTGQALPSVAYLSYVMDEFHGTYDVYTDAHAAGNHFAARGKMSSGGGADAVLVMEETCTVTPHSGSTCIRAGFQSRGQNWGGWYFMNGVLQGNERKPKENWGNYPDAGVDLRGATRLSFWARGQQGGELVEFFCLGVGRNAGDGSATMPYPDSSPKASTGFVTLSPQWTRYEINLQGRDIHYVLGGFGWVSSADRNPGDIAFYIDDIQFDKARLDDPRFLVSYQTLPTLLAFDNVMRNVAFTYDNAVALLAFLSAGDCRRARLLADALVYAQQHDRFYTDGRIRNAYQGGDLVLSPGWTPNGHQGTVRMPGWYETPAETWYEDEFQVSTHTGNVAWAMLALIASYEALGGSSYRVAAEAMGDWIEANCRDLRGQGGYTGGFEGWEPSPKMLMYKATEHNIDLVAAFGRLHALTQDPKWLTRAEHAKRFVLAMWDPVGGKFWTGTTEDGITINTATVPLDIQAWSLLALQQAGLPYWGALHYAELHHQVGSGFDFDEDRDGVWYEGTAHMAVAYRATGEVAKSQSLVSALQAAETALGSPLPGLPAASKDELTTGFLLPDGQPWYYFHRLHVGATAWLTLAETGTNPFIPPKSVCLCGDRFTAEVSWQTSQNSVGDGKPVSLTRECGYFWFFGPQNVELLVKVLDGRQVNGSFWVFYGALTDVAYTLRITDTQTGAVKTYINPQGTQAGRNDTRAFPENAPAVVRGQELFRAEVNRFDALLSWVRTYRPYPPRLTGGEPQSAEVLFLNGNRFRVTVTWNTPAGSGTGHPVNLTSDSGYFWFFDQANVELLVKVLDGRGVNGKFWVFYGALTDVGYTITITDTATGKTRIYQGQQGLQQSGNDVNAF